MGTVRFRLTFWYASLFLATGFVLLTLNFVVAGRTFPAEDSQLRGRVAERLGVPALAAPGMEFGFRPRPQDELRALAFDRVVRETREEIRREALRRLLIQSSVALAVIATLSVGAGWFIAGRMLQPVSDITDTVRRISGGRRQERVALGGPNDELKELADQFDAMLDRLDAAFSAQEEFVANASHELRTPLAVIRTELDVSLSDPGLTTEQARASAEVVRRATERAEALIAALLALARADAPADGLEPTDLAEVVGLVLEESAESAALAGVTIERSLAPASVPGNRVLLERLVENLVANGLAYNRRGGTLRVSVESISGLATLRVANSGDVIPSERVEGLFDRFRRLDNSRSRDSGGFGLGLAVVAAVARHHGGKAAARALPEGGLEVTVTMPLT